MAKRRVRKPEDLPDHPKPRPSPLHTPVGLSFRHAQPGDDFCLSRCQPHKVREYVDCLRQLTTLTWQQVLQTGGKGANKAGRGYTPYTDDALRHVSRPAWLSEDIRIAAVRASRKVRLFGCYVDHVFYVLWFDRGHDIVKG